MNNFAKKTSTKVEDTYNPSDITKNKKNISTPHLDDTPEGNKENTHRPMSP